MEWSKAPEQLILDAARTSNVLAITSKCNVRCIFCSHRQNPPGVRSYYVEEQSVEQVKLCAEFLDADKKIVLGESATRISEGEPFTHPKILDILRHVRDKYPATPLQITSNGRMLSKELLRRLKQFEPLELYLSLNSINPESRKKLMGDDTTPGIALLENLRQLDFSFHGSLVAMPWIVGWEDLTATIHALDRYNAKTIRVFMPGYSKLAGPELHFPAQLWGELERFLAERRRELAVPITLEPPLLKDLTAHITGIIKGSAAAKAGLKPGDIIVNVNGTSVFSRVDAFKRIAALAQARLDIRRNGKALALNLGKHKTEPSGLVVDYDLSREEVATIAQAMQGKRAQRPLLFASVAGHQVLRAGLMKYAPGLEPDLVPVPCRFFGGSIITAGLLVVDDFIAAWRELKNQAARPWDLIIIPAKPFDHLGRDLVGRSYLELADFAGVPVVAL